MEKLPDQVKNVLEEVMKNKYIVKVFDKIAEKYDRHEWNIGELNTYIIANKVEEIHIFKTEILDDLVLGEPE